MATPQSHRLLSRAFFVAGLCLGALVIIILSAVLSEGPPSDEASPTPDGTGIAVAPTSPGTGDGRRDALDPSLDSVPDKSGSESTTASRNEVELRLEVRQSDYRDAPPAAGAAVEILQVDGAVVGVGTAGADGVYVASIPLQEPLVLRATYESLVSTVAAKFPQEGASPRRVRLNIPGLSTVRLSLSGIDSPTFWKVEVGAPDGEGSYSLPVTRRIADGRWEGHVDVPAFLPAELTVFDQFGSVAQSVTHAGPLAFGEVWQVDLDAGSFTHPSFQLTLEFVPRVNRYQLPDSTPSFVKVALYSLDGASLGSKASFGRYPLRVTIDYDSSTEGLTCVCTSSEYAPVVFNLPLNDNAHESIEVISSHMIRVALDSAGIVSFLLRSEEDQRHAESFRIQGVLAAARLRVDLRPLEPNANQLELHGLDETYSGLILGEQWFLPISIGSGNRLEFSGFPPAEATELLTCEFELALEGQPASSVMVYAFQGERFFDHLRMTSPGRATTLFRGSWRLPDSPSLVFRAVADGDRELVLPLATRITDNGIALWRLRAQSGSRR